MHAIERHINDQNWIILVLIFALTLIAILKLYNPKRLFAYFFSFYLKTFFEKKVEENSSLFNLFNIILIFYSAIVMSLIVGFLLFKELNFINFIGILIAVLVYMLTKVSIDFLIEKLIHKNILTQYFRHTKLGYFLTYSIWLFPVIIIYQFQWKNQLFLLLSTIILACSRVIITTLKNKKFIFQSLFYFILYICTLEIAPLLIIYKLAE